MIQIDFHSRTPIYEQIKEQVMWLIRQGVYSPDEQLPSIRALSAALSLNVNTVKRAFQELEAMGITYSLPGRGIFVSKDAFRNKKIKTDALDELRSALLSAKAKGLSRSDIETLLDELEKGEV